MTRQPLRIGGYRYEHTEPPFDGRVSIEGVDAVFDSSPLVSDVFYKMVKGEYEAAEFGLTYFLRTFDTEESPFLALPIFPNRNFRHSAIFINTGSGIDKPEDLAGRTIGEFALYGHDAGVWPKGILSDEYGVKGLKAAAGSSAGPTTRSRPSPGSRSRSLTASASGTPLTG